MAYTPINWQDHHSTALSAENLGKMDAGIGEAHTLAETAQSRADSAYALAETAQSRADSAYALAEAGPEVPEVPVFYAPLAVSLLGLAEGDNGQSVGLADPSGVFSNGTPANQPLQLAGLPVSIGTPMTVVSAYVTLTSAVAGGTARVGLYGVNSSGQPTGAPLLDSGEILTDTTGTKSFSPASPLVLPAGTYWTLAVVSSTSVQFDGWRYARGGWRSGGYTLSPSGWNTALEVASTADPLPTLTATRLVRHNWSGRVSPLLTLQGPNS